MSRRDEMVRAMHYRYSMGAALTAEKERSLGNSVGSTLTASAVEYKDRSVGVNQQEPLRELEDNLSRLLEERGKLLESPLGGDNHAKGSAEETVNVNSTSPDASLREVDRSSSDFGISDILRNELENLRQDRAMLKQTVAQQLADAHELKAKNACLTDKLSELEKRLVALREEKSSLKAKTDRESAAKDKYSASINTFREEHTARLKDIEKRYSTAMNELRNQHAREKKDIEAQAVALQEEITAEKNNIHRELTATIAQMKGDQFELQRKYDVSRAELQEQQVLVNSERKRYADEVATLHEKLAEQSGAATDNEKLVDALRQSERKVEKQLRDKLETNEKVAKFEFQIRAISSELDAEKSASLKLSKAMADERATYVEEKQKLQKRIDALNKDLADQKEAFWDVAAIESAQIAPTKDSLDELKITDLEQELKAAYKEQEMLRCRLKNSQAEIVRINKRNKSSPVTKTKAVVAINTAKEPAPVSKFGASSPQVALIGAFFALLFACVVWFK